MFENWNKVVNEYDKFMKEEAGTVYEENREKPVFNGVQYNLLFSEMVTAAVRLKVAKATLLKSGTFRLLQDTLANKTACTEANLGKYDPNVYRMAILALYLKQFDKSDYSVYMYVLNPDIK